jgi:predicted PurR-regulated permease PerM
MTKGKKILYYSTLIILSTYFLFLGLPKSKGFLAPLVTAVILSLVVLPISRWLEKKGIKRGLASFLNTLIIFIISIGFMALVSFQIKGFVDSWPEINQTMEPKIERLKGFVFEHTPLEASDLEQTKSESGLSSISSGEKQGQKALAFFNMVVGFFGTYLLTFIYIFFILNYRNRFKEFLLRLFPNDKKQKVKDIIEKSANVTQQYLVGKLILMGILSILYSIGLGISGVDNFILVSIIAALLTLIPYIGNIIGFGLAMALGYLTSGETSVLIGIILTFSIAQFLESYVLQPYVVGDKVDLHPFLVILAVVLGNALWGIIGMILAIPILAIITVIFLNIPPLRPFGFLLSKD